MFRPSFPHAAPALGLLVVLPCVLFACTRDVPLGPDLDAAVPMDGGTGRVDAGLDASPPDSGPMDAGETAAYCDGVGPEVAFCDDFGGMELDLDKWWYGRKHWGPPPPRNHGVVPENVQVRDGRVFFAANGDRYDGMIQGVRNDGDYVQDQPGSRSGGILVSDAYFGSGRYEARMKLPPSTGVCSALWTFHYQEVYEGDPAYDGYVAEGNVPRGNPDDGHYLIVNHEIDIEVPTALAGEMDGAASYRNARYNTWLGETGAEYTGDVVDHGASLSDGRFHVFRFDWHTGDDGEAPRVEFYVDGVRTHTITTHIPYVKGRLTLGTWFPEWAGVEADFDVEYLEVDWVSVTPFAEAGDREAVESYPNDGLTKCADKAANDANEPACQLGGA